MKERKHISPEQKVVILREHLENQVPLSELSKSTFYDWYRSYHQGGYDGLSVGKPQARRFWNRIPESEKEQVVSIALDQPEKSPRQLAWYVTDTEGYFISESSVYRILKSYDLIPSPSYIVMQPQMSSSIPPKG
jgi:putative transposase